MPDTAVTSTQRPKQAITDLYDEQRRTFLIQYPIWVILGLSLSGVAIIALTGYLGYTKSEPLSQPWLLFLWFCAVLVTLQISIFRDASLRARLIATLIMSVLAIIFIGITYFNQSLQELISGDLIAAAVLTLVLSFLFEPQIISLFIHPQGVEITNCTVSWPIGMCVGYGAGPTNPPTLSFIDLIQTLLYLPLGLLILALTATVSGLGALQ